MVQSTPVKGITVTDATVDELKFAHRFILKRVQISEEQWCELMFENGHRYALLFSMLFGEKQEWLHNHLATHPAEDGAPGNWFWMWWKFKWMQDDYQYINNKVFQLGVCYETYKTYMLQSQMLEEDLVNILHSKIIL